ncbi:MAG: alpha/beta hydrolase [Lachnospiraceae bacterium]|nr:alpha/beta hydrolase [Lachnospiraceae bacterium]
MREKIAVLFPGIGYHVDKPLLYYSRKLALKRGYRVIPVLYGPFPLTVKGDAEAMRACAMQALVQAREELSAEELREADVIFFSKSIGTVVAAAYAKEQGLDVTQVYYTPIEETFAWAKKGCGLVFHGTKDPWVSTKTVKEACERLHLPCHVTKGANHSLETGDALRDLEIVADVIKTVQESFG